MTMAECHPERERVKENEKVRGLGAVVVVGVGLHCKKTDAVIIVMQINGGGGNCRHHQQAQQRLTFS